MPRQRRSAFGKIGSTERSRLRLCWLLMVLHGICLLLSLAVCATGGYVKLAVEPCTELVENFDGNVLFAIIIVVGLCSVVANIAGLYVAVAAIHPANRRELQRGFVIYLVFSVLACVALLAGAIVCLVHISHLHR